jgi:iron complex transport system ATP-binding protein
MTALAPEPSTRSLHGPIAGPCRPANTAPVLRFESVDVSVGGRLLLADLSLAVPATGLFGLVGPNGAGKSTLVRAALALLPTAHGRVWLAGRPLSQWAPRQRARQVGYVPQHLHSHWDLTVGELLQLALAPASAALLSAFELDALLHRRFNSLSGGEQARAAVARAMAHDPALLLADEPAAHLDLPHQHALMERLKACARRSAVLVVLHDLHLAARYCDRVAVLSAGRLVAHGMPQDVLASEVLGPAYGAALRSMRAEDQVFFTVRDAGPNAGTAAAPR